MVFIPSINSAHLESKKVYVFWFDSSGTLCHRALQKHYRQCMWISTETSSQHATQGFLPLYNAITSSSQFFLPTFSFPYHNHNNHNNKDFGVKKMKFQLLSNLNIDKNCHQQSIADGVLFSMTWKHMYGPLICIPS